MRFIFERDATTQRGAIQFSMTIGHVNSILCVLFTLQASGNELETVKPTVRLSAETQGVQVPMLRGPCAKVMVALAARWPATHSWRTVDLVNESGYGATKVFVPQCGWWVASCGRVLATRYD